MALRHWLLATLSLAVFGASAHAQELQEIVVTAQKRAENLQQVPLAVTAVTASAIENSGVRNSEDLGLAVPAMTVTRTTTAAQVFLRGIGTDSGQAGQEGAIATFIDGVYQPSISGATFSLNNIERIEVLKGPQGTLYGRNATGGAMNIITKTPSYDPGFSGEIGYGNLKTVYGNIYATAGLTDKIAMDVAGYLRRQDKGFGRNIVTGEDVNDSRDVAVRSKLLFEPGENTRIILSGDYSKFSGSLGVSQRPGDANGDPLPGFGWWDTQRTGHGDLFAKTWGGSARLEQDLGFANLTSVTAYRKAHYFQDGDLDLTPLPIIAYPLTERDSQFTQEVNLGSDAGRFKWIIGGFYLDSTGKYDPFQLIGVAFGPNPTDGAGLDASQKTKSYAAYGQMTFEILPATNLTLGARYTIDKRAATGTAFLVATGTRMDFFDLAPRRKTFRKATWRIALDHQFTDDVMGYASYSRGFKSGLFNLIALGVPTFADPVNPEVLDAYEVGLKSSLFDERLRLNLSGFYYKYKEMQVTIIRVGTDLLNAANSTIYGIDADAELAVTEQLTLRAGGSWLPRARYDDFVGAPQTFFGPSADCAAAICIRRGDASGNRLIKSPKTTFNVAANYEVPLANGKLATNVTYAYNSGFFWTADNLMRQKAYSLVNAQVQWTAPGDRFSLRAFARNLFDKKYNSQLTPVDPFGVTVSPAMGRTYGASVGVNF